MAFVHPFIRTAVYSMVCLAGTHRPLHAADQQTFSVRPPLSLHVHADGFGQVSAADLNAVLQSAADALQRYCPGTQLGKIEVYHRADHPQIDFQQTPNGRIAIGLTARDTHWAQYGFQFAHELCHALANRDHVPQPRSVPNRPPPNLWLEESLCETASLFTLRAMGRSWRTAPPYPSWRNYADFFDAYVKRRLSLPEHRLGKPFLAWFRENEAGLRRNAALRDQNTIIASRLLPLFEDEPRGWQTLAFLNRGSVDSTQTLALRLAAWRSRCPTDLRPFLNRLAAVFGVKV